MMPRTTRSTTNNTQHPHNFVVCFATCSSNVGNTASTGPNGFTVLVPADVTVVPGALTAGPGAPTGKNSRKQCVAQALS